MSGLVDKLKGSGSELAEGSKIPAGIPLKEDDPHKGTVQLDKVTGKCECHSFVQGWKRRISRIHRPHCWRARRFYPSLFISRPRLRRER